MSEAFNPYHAWLGIPPNEQPADYYRLLGIARFESDLQVIDGAADRQMAHLRSFQSGQHGDWAAKLLNEVARARICLLDDKSKAAYDERLRQTGKAEHLHRGDTFGQYQMLEPLNRSRTGLIFKGRHTTMGRIVAIKVLSSEAAATTLGERFARKIKILARLSHPNLVAAYEAGQSGENPYLVMEYVDGTTLAALVKQRGGLPVAEAVGYFMQAAEGLAHAHRHGVYHRNVKPSNLMVDRQGTVKVVGFGLAHVETGTDVNPEGLDRDLTRRGELIGSVDYMAPEQVVDAPNADQRADIYSLGCTLHALLTGRSPYPGKSVMQQVIAHRSHAIPSLRAERPDISPAIDAVFQRMMAKSAAERYPTVEAMLADLHRATGMAPAAASAVAAPEKSEASPRPVAARQAMGSAAAMIGGAAALVVVLLTLLVVAFWPGGQPKKTSAEDTSSPVQNAEVASAPEKTAIKPAMLVVDWPEADRLGSSLSIDGKDQLVLMVGELKFPAEPGEHRIVARRESYQDFEAKVQVAASQTATISPVWKRRTSPKPSPTPEPPKPPTAKQTPPKPSPTKPAEETPAVDPPKPVVEKTEPMTSDLPAPKAANRGKLPVPAGAELEKSMGLIQETYREELSGTPTGNQKWAVAKKLIEQAETMHEPVAQFACLEMARRLSVECSRLETACVAIDRMATTFELQPREAKADAAAEISKGAKTAAQHAWCAEQSLWLLTEAVAAADFAVGSRLCKLAVAEAGKSHEAETMQRARARQKEFDQQAKAFQAYDAARETLKTDPKNAVANVVAGRYECFVKGDWQLGVPMLALGDDEALRRLAKMEANPFPDTESQVALGDGWWEFAAKEQGAIQRRAQARAAQWYEKARPSVTGLVKAKVDKRLATWAEQPKDP